MATTSTTFDNTIPVYNAIPDGWAEAREYLVETLKEISNGINDREVGFYIDDQVTTGKSFIPGVTVSGSPPAMRTVLRKVVNCGTLPAGTGVPVTTTTAHGITFDDKFTLVEFYGASTRPVVPFSAISLPFVGSNLPSNISLQMDATNIYIISNTDYSAFTRTFVVIEYMQEI